MNLSIYTEDCVYQQWYFNFFDYVEEKYLEKYSENDIDHTWWTVLHHEVLKEFNATMDKYEVNLIFKNEIDLVYFLLRFS